MAIDIGIQQFQHVMFVWLAVPDMAGNVPLIRPILSVGVNRWNDFVFLMMEQVCILI
jgi:hypothetical protein